MNLQARYKSIEDRIMVSIFSRNVTRITFWLTRRQSVVLVYELMHLDASIQSEGTVNNSSRKSVLNKTLTNVENFNNEIYKLTKILLIKDTVRLVIKSDNHNNLSIDLDKNQARTFRSMLYQEAEKAEWDISIALIRKDKTNKKRSIDNQKILH